MGEPTNEEANSYPFLVYRTSTYRLSFQLDKKGKVSATIAASARFLAKLQSFGRWARSHAA